MFEDRRRFVRLDINVTVLWKKVSPGQREASCAQDVAKNISAGGICLILYERALKGDILALEIALPTGRKISTRGRVVWLKEFEILGRDREKKQEAGIEFMDISDEDRAEINKFVFSFLHAA